MRLNDRIKEIYHLWQLILNKLSIYLFRLLLFGFIISRFHFKPIRIRNTRNSRLVSITVSHAGLVVVYFLLNYGCLHGPHYLFLAMLRRLYLQYPYTYQQYYYCCFIILHRHFNLLFINIFIEFCSSIRKNK